MPSAGKINTGPILELVEQTPYVLIDEEVWRIVESQEEVATTALVDNLAEQDVLEQLLEQSKPDNPYNGDGLHYLLFTPFRYPPLKWGSRFGREFEPSLFYGSCTIETSLAEAAYYRCLFWQGMQTQPPKGLINTRHTLFKVRVETAHGADLTQPPYQDHQAQLMDTFSWSFCQDLGTALRDNDVQALRYTSARCQSKGQNIALYSPAALACKDPLATQNWHCETKKDQVSFSDFGGHYYVFQSKDLVDCTAEVPSGL